MSKNRPYVPPPILTPPSVVVPREAQRDADIVAALEKEVAQVATLAPPAQPLAIVPPPARVVKVELLADRIVLTNPTIVLDRYVELKGRDARGQLIQSTKLTPARAEVMHGEIWIEELGLLIPIGAAVIRTF